jgi:hypothetical protein
VGCTAAPPRANRGQERTEDGIRRWFLAAGLIPGFYLTRKLPLGLWFMAEGWSWIIGGTVLFVSFLFRKTFQFAGILLRASLALIAFGFVAGAMALLSRADARGESLPPDSAARGIALGIQVLCLIFVVRRARATGGRFTKEAAAYAAVIVTAALLAPLRDSTPGVVVVLAVSLVALRFAAISGAGRNSTAVRRPRSRATAFLFAWSVAVLGVQSGVIGRENGLGLLAVSLIVGLAVLLAVERRAGSPVGLPVLVSTGVAGVLTLVLLFVLIPTKASARFLFDWGFDSPAAFDLRGERLAPGYLERWYDTHLDVHAALLAAHRGMSWPVSEWAPAEGAGIDGHLYGYRLDVRAWYRRFGDPQFSRPPAGALCRTETGTCVRVRLLRSDDRDRDKPVRPLRLDP